jgi:hypothetical protein
MSNSAKVGFALILISIVVLAVIALLLLGAAL